MYLSEADIRLYYGSIFPQVQVASGLRHVFVPCILARHDGLVSVDLKTGRWSCSYCGSGDLFSFEVQRSLGDHRLRSQQRVLEIIASAREQAAGPSQSSASPQAEPDTYETRDVKKLLGNIHRHPGQPRAYYQRLSHWPGKRFGRTLRRLEREAQVRWQDSSATGGKKRRMYFPVSEREPSSNWKQG